MIVLDLETISTIDKQKLKKKLDFAFRQIVSEWRAEHWGTEEIYAMSFHMDYNNKDIKKRFSCKTMIQTKESCEDFKYLPKKYKYMEEGFSVFKSI